MSEPTSAASDKLPNFVVGLGKFIEAAMSTDWFVLIGVPILVTAGAIALRYFSRKSRRRDPADGLFGFDLGVTACLTLMVAGFVLLNNPSVSATASERQHYIVGLFIALILFVAALAIGAHLVHKRGWDASTPPKPTRRAWLLVNGVGAFLLVSAFAITRSSPP